MMIPCLSCPQKFENYHDLAVHIMASRTGHFRGRKWAANYLARKTLKPKIKRAAPEPDRKRTQYGDKNRARAVRELTGEQAYFDTICPQCRKKSRLELPVELQSDSAWRINGRLAILCPDCRR